LETVLNNNTALEGGVRKSQAVSYASAFFQLEGFVANRWAVSYQDQCLI